MTSRIGTGCVLLAAAAAGLLFAPVFGLWPLVPSIAVVLVACYAVWELCTRFPVLASWRPMLSLGAGLLGLVELELGGSTVAGLPTAATVRALVAGVIESWQLTLQTTWPVRPDADLLLFVAVAVLFAAVLGIELIRWPPLAVLPSLAVLGLSQAFVAWSGPAATVAALCYAAVAGGLFRASGSRPDVRPAAPRPTRAGVAAVLPAVVTAVVSVVAAVAVTAVDQGRQPAYSLRQSNPASVPPSRALNPLDELAARLQQPDVPVFSYASSEQVDRWRLVVLDHFNGVAWSTGGDYRRLGAELRTPSSVTVPTSVHSAQVWVPAGDHDEPWLPSQGMPVSVIGAGPLVAPDSGMLLVPERSGPLEYRLTWREPEVDPDELAGAALDPGVAVGDDLGMIPPEVAELARTATGGMRPSFRAALLLERYLSRNCRVATGAEVPTGSGWPQLRDFLLTTKRGTSEQFAAAYAALAKIVGIPARVAVGYRAPTSAAGGQVVVHNRDVLAWPEVAVAGVGWVPLDPTAGASGSSTSTSGLAQVTAKVRAGLPSQRDLPDPPLPDAGSDGSAGTDGGWSPPVLPIVLGLLALMFVTVLTVPVWKTARTWCRRRRAGGYGVIAAWREARDLLRAHGVPVTPGMTARDLAGAAAPIAGRSAVDGLLSLADRLDLALWSGADMESGDVGRAWEAVAAIRRGLAARPLTVRVRARFDPRGLSCRDSGSSRRSGRGFPGPALGMAADTTTRCAASSTYVGDIRPELRAIAWPEPVTAPVTPRTVAEDCAG